jgi:dynein heavy chain 1
MFAGISSVMLSEDGKVITGIASREGEELVLSAGGVSTVTYPKINEWLEQVESAMRLTLASCLEKAVAEGQTAADVVTGQWTEEAFVSWCDKFPAQIVVLATQVAWTEAVEKSLAENQVSTLQKITENIEKMLTMLSSLVLRNQPAIRRKKLEHLIYEYVHRRSITRKLLAKQVDSNRSFEWLSQMRFYFDPKNSDVLQQLSIHIADAKFQYGFEYLGVQDRLVMTPLTDRCYLTMTQALASSLGGSPFGPAGTGKTETVKALGNQLGRFVLVFNCDETFDFQAMGRIFVGLCQVGAWGCFDEFNRLEERMLSAVSQQIQAIQECLRSKSLEGSNVGSSLSVELVGKQVNVNTDMAIFITMNPGYAGRSNLPDNLKKLFRSLAMTRPDETLIAEVMLFSQGFSAAEQLSNKIVPLFKLCSEQLSPQSHYDFGLRALKSVLISAGNVKRDRLKVGSGGEAQQSGGEKSVLEQEILVQSVCETMVPKLVAEDIPLLDSLITDVFPNITYHRAEMDALRKIILDVCREKFLIAGLEAEDIGNGWLEKILQLYQISQIHHGLMMVGPSGSGKSQVNEQGLSV